MLQVSRQTTYVPLAWDKAKDDLKLLVPAFFTLAFIHLFLDTELLLRKRYEFGIDQSFQ